MTNCRFDFRDQNHAPLSAIPLPNSPRFDQDSKFKQVIRTLWEKSRETYGSPRMTAEMRELGHRINHKRVERLMHELGLYARPPRRFVCTTDSQHKNPVAPNLLEQNFQTDVPNTKWVGDITYIPTDEGWLYLSVIIDLYSRKVIGWNMARTLDAQHSVKAVRMAIEDRKPQAGLIFHSDRGCQYASQAFRDCLGKHGIRQSMSRRGCCYDNAVAESFFHTLKVECTHKRRFTTRKEAEFVIFEYIAAFYNRLRRHSSIGNCSPENYERQQDTAA